MNERIKEFAEQVYGSAHHDDFKFAELIVRDCCPQRPWVGLTDEEIGVPTEPIQPNEAIMFARVIEALIKGKNT
jgi:hypothetical protein